MSAWRANKAYAENDWVSRAVDATVTLWVQEAAPQGTSVSVWAANTDYAVGDWVTANSQQYRCLLLHRSGSTFAVMGIGTLEYRCIVSHTSGSVLREQDFTPDLNEYDDVRAALDVELSEDDLPDDIIDARIYKDAAVRDVDRKLRERSKAADFVVPVEGDTAWSQYRDAVILTIAAFLSPHVPRITAQTVGSIRRDFDEMGWRELQRALFSRIETILNELESQPIAERVPNSFSIARGGRAKWG